MRIGWIGLGRVGKQMALRALADGHTLTGHSRRFEHHAEIESAGGRLTASLEDAVRDAELVCVNVFSEAQLRDALLTNGALAAIPSGAILAIHSTVPPGIIEEFAAARPDLDLLDAGFSGTAQDAAAGQLMLMVGGRAEAFARAKSALGAYASTLHHLGPTGAGMTLKILNNLLFAAQLNLGREVLALATGRGIALPEALATLQGGSAASYALGTFQPPADPQIRFEGARPYLEKDVAIGVEAFPALQDLALATRIYLR